MMCQQDFHQWQHIQSLKISNSLISSFQDIEKRYNIQIQSKIDYETLIRFHKIYGNKWKDISSFLPDTTDSFIKNMFYTFARKALRKINSYMELSSKCSKKRAKIFKLNFVFKLANLAESERINRIYSYFGQEQLSISTQIQNFYTNLLYNLLEIGKQDSSRIKRISQLQQKALSFQEQNLKTEIDSLIQSLKTIQKIFIQQNLTKKGRTKKKFPKKGLIQKAYSSKAFQLQVKNEETSDYVSFQSISTYHHSKQYKQDFQFQQRQQQVKLQQIEINFQNINSIDLIEKNDISRSQLENMFEKAIFDPILFQ